MRFSGRILKAPDPGKRERLARAMATPLERTEVHYAGRVQGVGFRYTVQQLAHGFEVSGFVRNLPDGRVHLVAEGSPGETARFLEAIAQRMTDYIRATTVDRRPGTGEFPAFEIRC